MNENGNPYELLGIGEIAERAGTCRDRVAYAIRRAGAIPVARCGGVRVFLRGDLAGVFAELERLKDRRTQPELEA